ncbi:hypothetical protein [Haloferax sp. ATB1]|uniref:hypothetical protein n=1 Tax=Haloferax sp. ATB1 TaxID=1508454 RepID=UPI0019D6C570|nr:hypothetical protein [Haloferax sp. ATB1]
MGDFFTERIRKLREQYPCNGAGTVTTVGYSEFNPGSIKPVETNAESALFLSQWQYEAGSWTEQQQKQLADILRTFQRKNNLNLRVRPHPKDSEEKISRFFNDFQLSRGAGLESDIENHDIVLTVDSTALLRAVLRGKVPGVIDLPWEQNTFPHSLTIMCCLSIVISSILNNKLRNFLRRHKLTTFNASVTCLP